MKNDKNFSCVTFPPQLFQLISYRKSDITRENTRVLQNHDLLVLQEIRLVLLLISSSFSVDYSSLMVFVIGLVGGICSGKSTICKFLQQQEAVQPIYIINADQLGHQAYNIGTSAYYQIIATFGEDIINAETKEIDRPKLGGIVFKDKNEMQKLTDIVWPEIRRFIEVQLQQFEEQERKQNTSITIVLEAAVLVEAKWFDLCHRIWLVVAREDDVIPRLLQRNPTLTIEQATQRVQSQLTNLEEKKALAHRIIENNSDMTLEGLSMTVSQILQEETQRRAT